MFQIDFKPVHAAIWSDCAVLLVSEKTPLSLTACLFLSAALHTIPFTTCWFVPMPHTHRQMNDWKLEQSYECYFGLYQVQTKYIEIPFTIKLEKLSSLPIIYKVLKPFWLLNWILQEWIHIVLLVKKACCCQQLLLLTQKHPVFVPAHLTLLAVPELCPKSLAFGFAVNPFDYLLE